jgi:hypothetical protein
MGIRLFSDVLREIRNGEALDNLSEKLNQLVKAVDETGKGGELTLKITLKPMKSGAIEICDDVKIKKPELPVGTSLFFPTVEGNLQRNDPRQTEIPGLREVSTESKQVKEVANG